jgi:nicotinate-nucleotide adenylyltransferase
VAVGILGGAFDPPHDGHVALARRAIERFGLDRLLVTVVADPGHKDVVASAADRLALTRLAFADVPGAEVVLEPHGRTVDALDALALDDPIFLIGADELLDFPSWKEPERVLELARLGVATRRDASRGRLEAAIAALARPNRVELFDLEPRPISSRDLRARAARGERLDGLVPAAVADEVARLGLYGVGRDATVADTLPSSQKGTTPT